jgi:hypothetical protein
MYTTVLRVATHLRLQQQPSLIRFASKIPSVKRRYNRRIEIDSPEDPIPWFSSMSRQKSPRAVPGSRKKGFPEDSPETRNSKTLSWLLRHGAKSEGISMRSDGYVGVTELVSLLVKLEFGGSITQASAYSLRTTDLEISPS